MNTETGSSLVDVWFEKLNLSDLDSLDIARIAQLEAQLFGVGAWSAGMVVQELEAPGRTYFVARCRDDNTIIAYAGLWFDGDDAQIMTIGVDQQFQGRHIATQLMRMIQEEAKQLGATRVLLEVATDNDIALSLYRSAGFEQLGLRKRYYQPENKDAYTMAYTIADKTVHPIGFSVPDNIAQSSREQE
ncbi:ribosomal protein S18-alanine N-acetyltransferase [Alloscardovia omnicolens]|uniref:ribosomal protein S18-alanine N-acetyltransferase n=1 Tax=Alloscardovia omnicolens TaxID=419015 RepID=UPI003A7476F1